MHPFNLFDESNVDAIPTRCRPSRTGNSRRFLLCAT